MFAFYCSILLGEYRHKCVDIQYLFREKKNYLIDAWNWFCAKVMNERDVGFQLVIHKK